MSGSSPLGRALARLGVPTPQDAVAIGRATRPGSGAELVKRSPIDGQELARFPLATAADAPAVFEAATHAFEAWRVVPAPERGRLVRRLGEVLREHKQELAAIVSWEAGKITSEALGEVQEMIDICEFAVGLSRQLYGLTIASERPGHRLSELWHPLGPVAVITAFNFPVAVWAWNAAVALVCGNPVVWKPSEKTPLCALACHALAARVAGEFPRCPPGLLGLLVGGADVGQAMAESRRFPLVSATGSVRMGRHVAQAVAARLGRSLLELGGNNAAIVTPSADLELSLRAVVFSAVGTAGQRCTTLRRLIVHESIADAFVQRLEGTYTSLPIGDPTRDGTLVGPLIDEAAFAAMQAALRDAGARGGKVRGGDRVLAGVPNGGVYVRPAIVEIEPSAPIVQEETFAPIVYVSRYRDFDEAVRIQNGVSQGLASSIFTQDVLEAERFCSAAGSDCGIANVNVGPSGAEIGGAFGGEKDTGGGRESGSDSWKAYMRRVTSTVNFSGELPLAQGVVFLPSR
ncbi:MAG TPA: aldehyde dehydrogenase family protein [Polyangiaceae bacterium]|nr:aldehyde dehydrogenase family protein [Polyangiaceae bacterium]